MRQNISILLSAVCPVASTRMVDLGEPSTWSFEAGDGATPQQVAAGNALLSNIKLEDWNANETILEQIDVLEAQQSDRRIREAVLGLDGGFLANLNSQIVALRAQIKKFT